MIDLSTKYMGLNLKNPIIIGSSAFTSNIDSIIELEKAGAGAVVLKSLFEEEILNEASSLQNNKSYLMESADYLNHYVQQSNVDDYLRLIDTTKKKVALPVIASINCVSDGKWTGFAKRIENSGADALEINLFIMPVDFKQKGEEIEKTYHKIINSITKTVDIPVTIKLGYYFSNPANVLLGLSNTKIAGMVLFNKFFNPDIDINTMEFKSFPVFSNPQDLALPLRWTAILSPKVKCDIATSTGIFTGEDVVKTLLAGASAAQIVSVLYTQGIDVIKTITDDITKWMKEKNYKDINSFKGKLNYKNIDNAKIWDRSQFMKYFSDHHKK